MNEIKLTRIQGNYMSFLKKLQNTQLLILDDFGLSPFDREQRQALLDIVEHKYDQASLIFTSQIPVQDWHGLLKKSTIADAILDCIVYSSHRIELKGDTMKKNKLKK